MPPPLRLTLTDYLDATRWRWVLSDSRGRFLADHPVHLDPTSRAYAGWLDLRAYLDYHQPIVTPAMQLAELGQWIGAHVFGGLRAVLWQRRATPAVAVQVQVPAPAQELLGRPLELACFADGTPFTTAGVRFVYQMEGTPDPDTAKAPVAPALRILAAFSLPVRANPLNLRRERYGLQRLVRDLSRTQGLAVELRVLQYGATRATLQDALEEAEGWDIIHLSSHGERGELLLEDEAGGDDRIDAEALGELLQPARDRLKLLILAACSSGALGHAAARVQVGLDPGPTRQEGTADTSATVLPSLGMVLAQQLDCAALAMRYPVGDAFVTDLMLALYAKLLERRQPLPAALHLALRETLTAASTAPALSAITPILVGPRAAELHLRPPAQPPQGFTLSAVGLSLAFPPEPARFVGRLQPMLRASQALARHSARRGVLFYGMPGGGKTACALELAYRHEQARFQGYVWYQAPQAGSDIASAMFNLMQDIQSQLNAPELGLTTALDDPAYFRHFTLPRLRALLQDSSLLLVLDNLETLLTASAGWRDPLWGELIAALLAHDGPSRLVLTSRVPPADLANHPRLQAEAIHALSFAESVLLARELRQLGGLFADEAGQELLRQTLRLAQGHPKLLELADGLAVDRAALATRLAAAAGELADRATVLDAFLAAGGARVGETQQTEADFAPVLRGWTVGVMQHLSSTARLLFACLCRLEPEDRRQDIVAANWRDVLTRLGGEHAVAVAALAEPEQGVAPALAALAAAGLVAVQGPDTAQRQAWQAQIAVLTSAGNLPDGWESATLLAALEARATTYTIHPGVAEAARATTEPALLDAVDVEVGHYHIAVVRRGLQQEMTGGSRTVVQSARCAVPYLLRQARWDEASTLLEQMLLRDSSPESLAFALPLLRRIAAATVGTEGGLSDASVLATTLVDAGRSAEAEPLLRDVITRSAAQGDYRLASGTAGALLALLRSRGRLTEALALAEEMAGYTRQAGLGPWTQLGDETRRLRVLAAMGHDDEVLDAVEALRPQMQALPLLGEAEEAVHPWNVREPLLDIGRSAAMHSQRWETALALNAEIVEAKQVRGASALEVAGNRFNDYGPLLRLRRDDAARTLLRDCRAVFEAERAVRELGAVYSALADLEDKSGDRAAAVRFEEVALGYKYQAGAPEPCAISHHNLASYLERQGADAATVLAQRLAAATIGLQTQSGALPSIVRNLAIAGLPPTPPAFAAVVEGVEAMAGARFRALFDSLPRTLPDGDAAIDAVWSLVQAEQQRRQAEWERTLHQAEPLLQAIIAAASDASQRQALAPVLAELEENGWMVRQPVQRLWTGERDAAALTAGLDAGPAALVRQLVQRLLA